MILRPAKITDCADLAILDNIAGHDLPLALWQAAVANKDDLTALEAGRNGYLDQSGPCNWTNATIAEVDGVIAGATVGYALPVDVEMPEAGNPVMVPIYRLLGRAAGSWVIDVLAVFSSYRRQGIARTLLGGQIEQAGALTASIITNSDNDEALALYRSAGFVDRGQEPFVYLDDQQKSQYWLFLQREPKT